MQNEKTEAETKQLEVNTILTASAQLGDEATLDALCDVFDLDPKDIKAKLEKAAQGTPEAAQAMLAGVVTDEQATEGSPAIPVGR